MFKPIQTALIAALLLSGCAVQSTHRHHDDVVVVAPALPVIVELDTDHIYFHAGFYYHYHDRHWRYSRSRSGPWVALPRDRYPREVRYIYVAVAPVLPFIVELDFDHIYFHAGFYYFYDNHRWRYSRSRSGPWVDLPRDRYPREIRYKRDYDRDRDGYRNGDRDRDGYRSGDRDGDRDRYRDSDRDRDNYRSGDRDRDQDRGREVNREPDHDRGRDAVRSMDRDKGYEKDRGAVNERGREVNRVPDQGRGRNDDRSKGLDKGRDGDRGNDQDRDRGRDDDRR